MERELLESLAAQRYRAGVARLAVYGNKLSPTHAGRLLDRAGRRLHELWFGPLGLHGGEVQVPELLIVEGDGARYRSNEADCRKKGGHPRTAPKLPSGEEDHGWRENKIGLVRRALRGKTLASGRYEGPTELLKTYVATTSAWQDFERDLEIELLRRGAQPLWEIVAVSDNGHGLPLMWGRLFAALKATLRRVTDFYHCAERLNACAQAVYGEAPATQSRRRKWFHRLRQLLWDGRLPKILATLRTAATPRAPETATPEELAGKPAAKTLWSNVHYFEKYGDTMDYPAYRAKGWPLGSGAVESACGQMGDRVKHNRMRWTRQNADALHIVKAAICSGDGRWAKLWPPPIPVLDFPVSLLN